MFELFLIIGGVVVIGLVLLALPRLRTRPGDDDAGNTRSAAMPGAEGQSVSAAGEVAPGEPERRST